jgi:hypothetical protein
MEVSKTKSSFYRRLYVAWLIDSQTATSVPALMEATGMPGAQPRTPSPPWPTWTSSASSSSWKAHATTPGITAS